ncbi:MAG: 4-hydroxy-tetrahydrodipicolinate reductase, partial [Acetobacteraceae bacterium]
MTIRIGIAGITGRMGRLVAEEVERAGCELAGGIRRPGAAMVPGLPLKADLMELARVAQVVIDFSHPSSVVTHAVALVEAGSGWVLGTSGLGAAEEAAIAAAAEHIPVLYAANFSPAMTLMLALAERMAAALPAAEYDAEILEMHHRQKADAPSGT